MAAMNAFYKPQAQTGEYRPILRASATEPGRTDSQESECCCPDLCCIDHDN